jgi:hypothetical protein
MGRRKEKVGREEEKKIRSQSLTTAALIEAQGRVPTVEVVPALEELEHRPAGLLLVFEASAIEQLALQGGKEALAQSVVEAVAHRAHRGANPRLTATLAEGQGGVLCTLIGVVDHPFGPTLLQGHVQSLQNQLGAQMGRHRPADDPAAPGIHHHRQVQESCPGRDVGDVGHPEPIPARGGEVPLHQIRGGTHLLVPHRGGGPPTTAGPLQTRLTHQASHSFAAHWGA